MTKTLTRFMGCLAVVIGLVALCLCAHADLTKYHDEAATFYDAGPSPCDDCKPVLPCLPDDGGREPAENVQAASPYDDALALGRRHRGVKKYRWKYKQAPAKGCKTCALPWRPPLTV